MTQLATEGRWHMVEPFYNLGGQVLDIRTVNQRLESGNYASAANFQSQLLSIPTSFLAKGSSRAHEKASDLLQELPTLFKRRQLQDTLLRKRTQQQQQPQQQQQQQQQGQEPTGSSSAQVANHGQPVSVVSGNQAASSATAVDPQSPPASGESAVPSPNHRRSLSIRPTDPSVTLQVQHQAGEAQTSCTGTTVHESEGGDSGPDQNAIEQPTKHSAKRAASPQDLPAAKRPRQDVSSSKSMGAQTGTQNLAYTPALHDVIEAAMVREARVIAEMQKSTNLEGDRKKFLQRASLTKRQKVRESIEGELKRDHVRAVAASMHEEIRKASMDILDRLIAEDAEHKQQEIFDKQQKRIDELEWTVDKQQHTINTQRELISSLQQAEQADEETIEEARAGKKRKH
ncbi:hypothetical protein KCU98_g1649, partial [Aureobasidium melanogenum]